MTYDHLFERILSYTTDLSPPYPSIYIRNVENLHVVHNKDGKRLNCIFHSTKIRIDKGWTLLYICMYIFPRLNSIFHLVNSHKTRMKEPKKKTKYFYFYHIYHLSHSRFSFFFFSKYETIIPSFFFSHFNNGGTTALLPRRNRLHDFNWRETCLQTTPPLAAAESVSEMLFLSRFSRRPIRIFRRKTRSFRHDDDGDRRRWVSESAFWSDL